jgi:hypothetical protein
LVVVLDAAEGGAFCAGDGTTGVAVGTTTGAVVVGAVPGTAGGVGVGTGVGIVAAADPVTAGFVGVTAGTAGLIVEIGTVALCALPAPLGQPIAATNPNRAVVDTPATRIFAA